MRLMDRHFAIVGLLCHDGQMALDLPPISKSDIDSTGWEKLLEQARERTCFAYVVILASAIEEAEKK